MMTKKEMYILHIHTSTENALVSVSTKEKTISAVQNPVAREHAAFLHPAINKVLEDARLDPGKLSAVAVTNGPGSYTGIRIGLAAAKGLCFALQIPLITINTLELLAASAKETVSEQGVYYCPMIDARRMEVYTAVYSPDLQIIVPPQAMILDNSSFAGIVSNHAVCFFGSGSEKFRYLHEKGENMSFADVSIDPDAFRKIGHRKYSESAFSDVAYSEPEYLKEFYTPS